MADRPAVGESSDTLLRRLRRLDTCNVSDAMDALGLANALLDDVRPLWEGATTVGWALTMELAPCPVPPDVAAVHLGARAVSRGGPGTVIVVANGGRLEMGSWGGLLTTAALTQQISGVILDGACRDLDEIRAAGFPAFGKGTAARTARGRVYERALGEPVEIGGVVVATGYLIIADASGVIALDPSIADEVLNRAEDLADHERDLAERLRSGTPAHQVLGAPYEQMLGRDRSEGRSHVGH